MNHQKDVDDDSTALKTKNISDEQSVTKFSPNIISPSTSKPIVRKLCESRKIPFQTNNRDDSQPCTSSHLLTSSASSIKKLNTTTSTSTSSSSSSSCRYAFNFNAIKSRFADPKEPINTKKRQFEGIKNDLNTTDTESSKSANQTKNLLTDQSAAQTSSTPDSMCSLLTENKIQIIQSESKRQKSSDKNQEECSSSSNENRINNFLAKEIGNDFVESSQFSTPPIKASDNFVSVITTFEPEIAPRHYSQMSKEEEEVNQVQSGPIINSVLDETESADNAQSETPFVTRIQIKVPDEQSENCENLATPISNQLKVANDFDDEDNDDDDDDDVDLSDIGLSSEFIKHREEEKAKEKKKQEEAEDRAKHETPTDPKQPGYWENIFKSEFHKSGSLTLTDLINKEFGYAGRMGHGNRNNFFRPRGILETQIFYDQQMQSSREYINKALSNLNLVRRLKQSHRLVEHDGCVNALNFNQTGTLMLSGSDDYRVCIWDWNKSNVVLQYESGHKSNVFQTKFVPYSGDTQIVTCARDGQIRLALISSDGTHIGTKRLAKHADSCHKLSIEYDSSNLFLSCGEDGVVFEIDLRQSQPAKILTVKSQTRGYRLPLYSIHSNPSDTYQFCVVGRDPFIRIYDKRMLVTDKSKMVKKFCPSHLVDSQRSSITSAVYNHNGTEIIASYSDDDIYLYKTSQEEGQEATHHYGGHRNSDTVKGVNYYGANSDYIISGSDCGRVFFWEKRTQQIVQVLKSDDEENNSIVNVLEPHPSFPYLATSGLDSDIKIWSPSDDEPSKLENLSEIIRQNKIVRETSRQFNLSSFEFELLLLLMHRPNSRVLVGSTNNDEITTRLNSSGVSRMTNESTVGVDLFGSYSLRSRRGLLPTSISNAFANLDEDDVREFSPVNDDDDDDEQSYDEDEEDDAFMDFEDEE